LLPQTEEDTRIASLLRLNSKKSKFPQKFLILLLQFTQLILHSGAEERQQDVRKSIEIRSLFKDEMKPKSSVMALSRNATATPSLTRQSLGVSLKNGKERSESSAPKIPNLCDYTSSSSEDSS